jgi:hypothetical protein
MYVKVWVDYDDLLDEVSDEELIGMLNERNYNWDLMHPVEAGVFIPAASLGDVSTIASVLDAAGIKYDVIK